MRIKVGLMLAVLLLIADISNGYNLSPMWKINLGIIEKNNSILTIRDIIIVSSRGTEVWRPDDKDGVYAVDATGDILWHFKTEDDAFGCGARDLDGDGIDEIIVGSRNRVVYCLDIEGNLKWRFNTDGYPISSPTISDVDGDGDIDVLVGCTDGSIYCIGGLNGNTQWSYKADGSVISSPAVCDVEGNGVTDLVFGDGKRWVYRLKGIGGRLIWRSRVDDEVDSSPAAADLDGDGMIEMVMGSWGGVVYCFNGDSGDTEWTFKTNGSVVSSPAIGDLDDDSKPEVVFGSLDHHLYCVDGITGEEKWAFDTGASISSSPVIGDLDGDKMPEVVIGDHNGHLRAINGRNGEVKTEVVLYSKIESTPVLCDFEKDGKLEVIVGDINGNLYRFDAPEGGNLVWARFQFDSSNSGFPDLLLGSESTDIDIPPKFPWMKNRDAVCVSVGISRYRYAPSASYADKDAVVFAKYAKSVFGVQNENLYPLTNAEATKEEFEKLFGEHGWIARRVNINPDQTDVFVFYSGHGTVSESIRHLLPYDSDPNYSAGFSLERILDSFRTQGARSVTIFIDACFSGQTRNNKPLVKGSKSSILPRIDIPSPSGVTIYTSSFGAQISSSYDAHKHGLFTYSLLRGLRGEGDLNNDGVITVNELYEFIRRDVSRRSVREVDREQTPTLTTDDESRILVRLKK